MPRRHSGGNSRKPSGGNTRRVRQKGKNTYAAKQAFASSYWLAQGAYRSQRGVPVARPAATVTGARPEMGRKNKPNPKSKPQKPKRPKGGSK